MSALLEILAGSLGRGAVDQISSKLGLNPNTTGRIVQAAIPLLVGALARNSASPSGATALQGALSKDHDGSVLDDVLGFLGSSQQGPGAGILRHVLGDQQSNVQSSIGQVAGVDGAQAGQVLEMLAPLVMGALGKKSAQEGLDAGGLSQFLQGEAQAVQQPQPDIMGSLLGMLDQNKDGNVVDDVSSLLGKLLNNR
ncbi:MAG: DUF937 domain-containing protein [Ignavibacteriae bacterium]|nr:DUF937 domain-containing protein [Ignavibacteriota bacterium]